MNDQRGFIIRKVLGSLDLGSVLIAAIKSPQNIIENLTRLIQVALTIDIKILEIITQAQINLRPMVAAYFVYRVKVLKDSLSWKKWFFHTSDVLERQAVIRAAEETRLLVDILSSPSNKLISDLLSVRSEANQQIINELRTFLSEIRATQLNNQEMFRMIRRN